MQKLIDETEGPDERLELLIFVAKLEEQMETTRIFGTLKKMFKPVKRQLLYDMLGTKDADLVCKYVSTMGRGSSLNP